MPSIQFDANESKVLNSMFDQTLKQFAKSGANINRQAAEVVENVAYKLKAHKGKKINFSQQEHTFLKQSIKEAIVQMNKQIGEVWFGKRWLMKMMLKSYVQISSKINNMPIASKKKK